MAAVSGFCFRTGGRFFSTEPEGFAKERARLTPDQFETFRKMELCSKDNGYVDFNNPELGHRSEVVKEVFWGIIVPFTTFMATIGFFVAGPLGAAALGLFGAVTGSTLGLIYCAVRKDEIEYSWGQHTSDIIKKMQYSRNELLSLDEVRKKLDELLREMEFDDPSKIPFQDKMEASDWEAIEEIALFIHSIENSDDKKAAKSFFRFNLENRTKSACISALLNSIVRVSKRKEVEVPFFLRPLKTFLSVFSDFPRELAMHKQREERKKGLEANTVQS